MGATSIRRDVSLEGGLTVRQRDLLAFIREYVLHTGGVSPSISEMANAMGFAPTSRGAVHRLLSALRERGFISHNRHMARSLRVAVPKRSPIVALEEAIHDLEGQAGTNITFEVLTTWVEIYRLKMPSAEAA